MTWASNTRRDPCKLIKDNFRGRIFRNVIYIPLQVSVSSNGTERTWLLAKIQSRVIHTSSAEPGTKDE